MLPGADAALFGMADAKKRSGKKLLTTVVAIVAVGASLWYLARGFKWPEVWGLLKQMHLGWFVLGVWVANVPYWHVRALRWWLLMRRCGEDPPYRKLHLATMMGVAFAPVTPGQVGEAMKVEMLHRSSGTGRAAGYGTHLVERVFDLGVLLTFGLLGAASGTFPALADLAWLMWLGLAGILAGFAVFCKVTLPGRIGEFQGKVRGWLAHLPTTLAVGALSLLGWTIVAFGWQLVLRSIGLELSVLHLFGFMAAGTVMLILSFVPAGVGVWEAGGSLLLMATGVSEVEAQAGALTLRLYSFATLLLATGIWLCRRTARATASSLQSED